MKKFTIPFLALPLLLACGAETQKPSEPVRGPSVTGPTENKPAPAAAKPVPVIAEKPVEAAPRKNKNPGYLFRDNRGRYY